MIQLTDVSKLFGNHVAVRNLYFDVKDGEIMGIIGHNGAGKSTTLKMISGLVTPSSGVVEVMGKNMNNSQASKTVKQNLGYLPEESPLYNNMTVTGYLHYFGEIYQLPRAKIEERIETLLASLKLPEKERLTGELSKGMKRKVAIARVLLHDPQLLILDEPNSGLDPLTSFFIINYLKELRNQGKTILLSAHNLFHIEYICDRVAIMKDGRLLLCDTMDAIRERLGHREFEIVFQTDEKLPYKMLDGNYLYTTTNVAEIANMLSQISENNWTLVNLSVHESALEEIYVNLFSNG